MKKHFVNKALSVALLGCGLWTAGSAVAAVPDSVYLMAYNVHAGGGLNFAWSANRQAWSGKVLVPAMLLLRVILVYGVLKKGCIIRI